MLHNIDTKGWDAKTAWCVPTAISFLTGIPLIHSHSRAAFIQNQAIDAVKGVEASDALLLLREQGYRAKQITLKDRYSDAPRLGAFLKELSEYQKCMPLMIQVEDNSNFCHMISAHFGYVADNWTMKPVTLKEFPHKNKYVVSAWIVEKVK
jgi:hypothetical protein